MMIECRSAPAQGEFGEAEGGRGADMVGRDPGPDRIEGAQPIEQTDVLRSRDDPGQRLIEMVMGIDQTGKTPNSGMSIQTPHVAGSNVPISKSMVSVPSA